jgi:hypothetical protein
MNNNIGLMALAGAAPGLIAVAAIFWQGGAIVERLDGTGKMLSSVVEDVSAITEDFHMYKLERMSKDATIQQQMDSIRTQVESLEKRIVAHEGYARDMSDRRVEIISDIADMRSRLDAIAREGDSRLLRSEFRKLWNDFCSKHPDLGLDFFE